jgi:peptidoglycan/LPS O-acetylase OafA/YrhL
MEKARDPSIDWMRALSILYIVGFWHLHNYTTFVPWYRAAPFARLGVTGLALFVLISGFLAGRAGEGISARKIAAYYRRRLIRIYPPYLMALMVFTVLGLSGAEFLPSALMVNMIVPPPPLTLWFMTMIVLFYLAAPFMLTCAQRPVKMVAVVGAVWVVLFAVDQLWFDIEDRLLIYLPAFTAGMLIANNRERGRLLLLIASGCGSVVGYVLSLRAVGADPDQSLWMLLWASASAVFTFLTLHGRLPRSRVIEHLSFGGFFLYLFHRPIYVILLEVSGIESAWGRELLLVCLGLPLGIAFGIVAQRAYDALIATAVEGAAPKPEPEAHQRSG